MAWVEPGNLDIYCPEGSIFTLKLPLPEILRKTKREMNYIMLNECHLKNEKSPEISGFYKKE
ncbi:MAG: hypothetical protein QM426_04295 [Euryarchaeota archaeon]|nr:hypothetical protein [Euryarchaeota archaeon]